VFVVCRRLMEASSIRMTLPGKNRRARANSYLARAILRIFQRKTAKARYIYLTIPEGNIFKEVRFA
jgi:hypothetical protein